MLILGAFASAMPLVSQTLVVDGDIDTGGVFRQGGSPMLVTGTIGGTNIGVGFEAGQSRTTGDFNTALGTRSLRTNTVGSLNTVVGYRVLYNNTGGHDNVSVGQDSLFFNDMLSSRGGWDPDGVWHPVPYVDEKAA